jgi:hypothetical protein
LSFSSQYAATTIGGRIGGRPKKERIFFRRLDDKKWNHKGQNGECEKDCSAHTQFPYLLCSSSYPHHSRAGFLVPSNTGLTETTRPIDENLFFFCTCKGRSMSFLPTSKALTLRFASALTVSFIAIFPVQEELFS